MCCLGRFRRKGSGITHLAETLSNEVITSQSYMKHYNILRPFLEMALVIRYRKISCLSLPEFRPLTSALHTETAALKLHHRMIGKAMRLYYDQSNDSHAEMKCSFQGHDSRR